MAPALSVSLRALVLFLTVYKWQLASAGLTVGSWYYRIRKSKRIQMAKLLDQKIGEYGDVVIELKEGGVMALDLHLTADVIEEARKLVAKTATNFDNKLVEMLASLVGHKDKVGVAAADPVSADGQVLPQAEQA